ncbi:hypothetical protein [Paractinoplanes rishiriensis]|uniref:Uncharacterized protein n=1 Tax=Paractinoplanes rishiriensis TaxID=1050105 RepID=A0A919N2L3_9ACTN|nr:hypothetical protein [Actinoplanes rishiriensis]GIF00733.1 hypothetical protein Ari01nite_81970 [Actinoplanes rishiriensis]
MLSRDWNNDDAFMDDLSESLRPSPVEQRVIDAASGLLAWRLRADDDLAALLYDSYLDESASIRAGTHGEPQTLVFGHGPVQIEIEVSDGGIEGQLIPPRPGVVRLCTIAGTRTETIVDEVGCFSFPPVHQGPIRLECVISGGNYLTEWISVRASRIGGDAFSEGQ